MKTFSVISGRPIPANGDAQRFIVDNVDAVMTFAADKEKGAQR